MHFPLYRFAGVSSMAAKRIVDVRHTQAKSELFQPGSKNVDLFDF